MYIFSLQNIVNIWETPQFIFELPFIRNVKFKSIF